jgi:putative membrane protein
MPGTISPSRDLAGDEAASLRLHQGLLATYLVLWAVLAVDPVDRRDWMLENVLAVGTFGLLIGTYRRFRFSDLSYILIALFMALHAVGAHYTYEHVPAGDWLRGAFDHERNHFDRLTHGAFGLLLTYPVREVFMRLVHVRGFWSHYFAVTTITALSGLFEILEAWVAQVVSPELGTLYLGTQGDIWDAQEDMTAVLAGSLLCTVLTVLARRMSPR